MNPESRAQIVAHLRAIADLLSRDADLADALVDPIAQPLVSADQLVALYRCARDTADKWSGPLDSAMRAYGIVTPARIRAFLAQIGHESGRLRYVREIWGPTPAQSRYEGRADLGNTQTGDGSRYRGRGLIQITGRANYAEASRALSVDFVSQPELIESPQWAALSAAWYWHARGLNQLADEGRFEQITRRINGGLNGQADRLALYQAAEEVVT